MVNMKSCALVIFFITLPYLMGIATAASEPQCGWQQLGHHCEPGYCCSQFGFCGKTAQHCTNHCQWGYGDCWRSATNQAIADAEAQAQAQAWAQTQAAHTDAQSEAQVETVRVAASAP